MMRILAVSPFHKAAKQQLFTVINENIVPISGSGLLKALKCLDLVLEQTCLFQMFGTYSHV